MWLQSDRARLVLAALAAAALAAVVFQRWSVTTDITEFLPGQPNREQVQIGRLLADSEVSRTMVLTLGAADPEIARVASRELERALRADPELDAGLAYVEGGPPKGLDRAMYDLYHPRRLSFLAETPQAVRDRLSVEALRASARELRGKLAQPMSPLLGRLAPSDPLLILPSLFERLQGARGAALRVEDGRFMDRDGRHAVLFLGTQPRAFDSTAQAPLLAGIRRAFDAVNRRHSGALELEQSGVNRFAVRSEQAIKADIQRVSLLSVLGLSLLLIVLFRSARLVLLAAIPLAFGVLAGCAACLLAYGRIHGVTLAFGASLLGVGIDYVVHFYCHSAVAPHARGARGTLRSIRLSLCVGASTTLVGFIALGGAGFPGLSEVALFASSGIAAALAATLFVLPCLLPSAARPVAARERLVHGLVRLLDLLRTRRRVLWALPVLAVLFSAAALPQVHGSDAGFMSMGRLDPELLAEDERVRARVARFDGLRFVVSVGVDEDRALRRNDAVADALLRVQKAGNLGGFHGIAGLLPAPSRQLAVARAVLETPDLEQRVGRAFAAEGFVEGAVAPFLHTLDQPAPAPLTFDLLKGSPLAQLVRPFRLELPGKTAFITFLMDVRDPEALREALVDIPGAHLIEQGEQLRRTHALYQARAVRWLGAGLVGVLLILALRYRNLRRTVAAFVPAVLAAGVTVATLTFAQCGLDLVVLTALLMVVSMGVDYGVFLVDADSGIDAELHRPAALLSVGVAACSTILGFGLLALSDHPLLFSIGLTAGVGIVACLLLAPTTLVLVGSGRAGSRRGEP